MSTVGSARSSTRSLPGIYRLTFELHEYRRGFFREVDPGDRRGRRVPLLPRAAAHRARSASPAIAAADGHRQRRRHRSRRSTGMDAGGVRGGGRAVVRGRARLPGAARRRSAHSILGHPVRAAEAIALAAPERGPGGAAGGTSPHRRAAGDGLLAVLSRAGLRPRAAGGDRGARSAQRRVRGALRLPVRHLRRRTAAIGHRAAAGAGAGTGPRTRNDDRGLRDVVAIARRAGDRALGMRRRRELDEAGDPLRQGGGLDLPHQCHAPDRCPPDPRVVIHGSTEHPARGIHRRPGDG